MSEESDEVCSATTCVVKVKVRSNDYGQIFAFFILSCRAECTVLNFKVFSKNCWCQSNIHSKTRDFTTEAIVSVS
jgi:hypothetical protein